MTDPAWVADAVAYQIFVDRFARSLPPRLPGSGGLFRHIGGDAPSCDGFMGGDLAGITGRLAYLQELGINLISLTPIFLASSPHRYDTYDYDRIDPRLGGLDGLRLLIDEARRRGIRVLLDGCFNHCGRGFFPFFDLMENGNRSAWKDWFYVEDFPVDAYGAHRYKSWQDVASLPEFDLDCPEARDYLLGVAAFWTSQGIDGWRLDAVRHARSRHFWDDFRKTVKRVNPEAYLLAEIWEDPSPWLDAGYFDGATNYALRELVVDFVIEHSLAASDFAAGLEKLFRRSSRRITAGMWNVLGTHDTPRIASIARGDLDLVRLAFAVQFCAPGIPAVYYGDEIALQNPLEPDHRHPMIWGDPEPAAGFRTWVTDLVRVRCTLEPLRYGDWRTLLADDRQGVVAFERWFAGESAILVVHAGDSGIDIDLPRDGDASFIEPLTGERHASRSGRLRIGEVAPRTARLLGMAPVRARAKLRTEKIQGNRDRPDDRELP